LRILGKKPISRMNGITTRRRRQIYQTIDIKLTR
jgi:hypothetical protein